MRGDRSSRDAETNTDFVIAQPVGHGGNHLFFTARKRHHGSPRSNRAPESFTRGS